MKTLLSLFCDFRAIRKYLGGEWVKVHRRTPGAMGWSGDMLWIRPHEISNGDEVLGRESWPTREVRP